ncbi:hypothetical protein [Saccharothrix sp. HUAS TT1]|uniref:hypothetical protein n=1 Tax=unclassified Saccharothrix TaxID=2593673 RepID=UPI00345BBE9F
MPERRRAGSWRWLAQSAVLAAVLVLATAGAAIGWRVGGLTGVAVGAGAGLLVAALLVLAADRLTSALVARPPDRRRPGDDRR